MRIYIVYFVFLLCIILQVDANDQYIKRAEETGIYAETLKKITVKANK